ncbi:hypothetical protein N7931_05045 [Catenovulum sp. 2E275]|uniref:hypothetical protein n=1 Tax=Catenovulum sp. 2E275 TaxID=2980497 RepID=UPI0021D1C8FB|nr:hypothetical protein [Catenovulum sp. 2E275]MCU4674995.1 hypothetical protein [Catenovulum sp. 2E275]
MTQSLSLYQQAILAELNIPVFQHKSNSVTSVLSCEQVSEYVPESLAPNSNSANLTDANFTKSDQNSSSENIAAENNQSASVSSAESVSVKSPDLIEQDTNSVMHAATQAEPSELNQSNHNQDFHVTSDTLSDEQPVVKAETQQQPNKTNVQLTDEQKSQLERDKTIADKTRMINQLAAILPSQSSVDESAETEQNNASVELNITALDSQDLAALQTWALNNSWSFEQNEQLISATHPNLAENKSFNLATATDKKAFWLFVLSLLDKTS